MSFSTIMSTFSSIWENTFDGWRFIFAAVLIELCLGTMYMFGYVTIFLTSYLYQFDSNITYEKSIFIYAGVIAGQGIGVLLAGNVELMLGSRLTCLFGGYLFALSVFITSFCKNLFTMIIFYGLLMVIIIIYYYYIYYYHSFYLI
jgi:hypothetical protein